MARALLYVLMFWLVGESIICACVWFPFQDAVSSLERELELKRAIVDATKRLVDETHNKKLKKDRRKELKDQLDKVCGAVLLFSQGPCRHSLLDRP